MLQFESEDEIRSVYDSLIPKVDVCGIDPISNLLHTLSNSVSGHFPFLSIYRAAFVRISNIHQYSCTLNFFGTSRRMGEYPTSP
jgi:hypothetical protein